MDNWNSHPFDYFHIHLSTHIWTPIQQQYNYISTIQDTAILTNEVFSLSPE